LGGLLKFSLEQTAESKVDPVDVGRGENLIPTSRRKKGHPLVVGWVRF
jgi:hypothetical protein